MWSNLLFGCHTCGPEWRKPLIQPSMVTNQNQLSNGQPVYTGNQSISTMYNLLHHFTCRLLLFFKTKMDTSFSGSTAGPRSGSRQPRVWEKGAKLESNLLQVSPRRRAVLILALTSSPYQQILPFFPQTCWLRISLENWGRRRRGRERREGEKTAPGLEEDIVCMCTEAQGLWPAA